MIPEKGQHVKCFMRSTMVLEGIVEDWADAQIVLKSLNGENIMIVHHPAEDIVLTKIVLREPQKTEETPKETSEAKEQIADKLREVLNSDNNDLEKLNIKRLRQLVAEQERQIIIQKRREHFGTVGAARRNVPYSNPFGDIKSAYKPARLPNTPAAEMSRKK